MDFRIKRRKGRGLLLKVRGLEQGLKLVEGKDPFELKNTYAGPGLKVK